MSEIALVGKIAALSLRPVRLSVNGQPLTVEAAATPRQRALGLSGRDVACDCGMLFVMPRLGLHAFWMKGTFCPLSIAFLRDDGVIVAIRDLTPQSLERIGPPEPVRLALEAPLGWFAARGIGPGDRVAVLS